MEILIVITEIKMEIMEIKMEIMEISCIVMIMIFTSEGFLVDPHSWHFHSPSMATWSKWPPHPQTWLYLKILLFWKNQPKILWKVNSPRFLCSRHEQKVPKNEISKVKERQIKHIIIVCFVTKRFKPHCEDLTSGTIALKLPGRRKRSSPCEAPHEHWGVPDHTLQQTREGENRLRHGKSSTIRGFYMWVLALRMAMVSPGRKQY